MKYTKRLSDIIKEFRCKKTSILEAGVGEATTLTSLLNQGDLVFKDIYGFDISWSRVKFAKKFLKSRFQAHVASHRGGGYL